MKSAYENDFDELVLAEMAFLINKNLGYKF